MTKGGQGATRCNVAWGGLLASGLLAIGVLMYAGGVDVVCLGRGCRTA